MARPFLFVYPFNFTTMRIKCTFLLTGIALIGLTGCNKDEDHSCVCRDADNEVTSQLEICSTPEETAETRCEEFEIEDDETCSIE